MRIRPLLALTLVAAACTSGGGSPATTADSITIPPQTTVAPTTATTAVVTVVEPVTGPIVVWAPARAAGPLRDAAAAFTADTGIEVAVEEHTLAEIMAGAADPGGPDAFYGPHDWIAELARAGALEPLTFEPEGLIESAIDAFTLRGTIYGVPLTVQTAALFRNTGLAPDPVTETADFLSTCEQRSAQQPCIAVPAADGETHYPYLAADGGYLFAYSPTDGYDLDDIGLSSEGAVTGLETINIWLGSELLTLLPDGAAQAEFLGGNARFLLVGPGEMQEVLDALPASNLAYAIHPPPPVGEIPAPALMEASGVFVSAFGEEKVAAAELVTNYLRSAAVPGAVPADPAGAEGDAAALAAVAALGDPRPPIPESALAFDAFGVAVAMVYEGTDVSQALAEGARTLRNALESADQEPADPDEG